MSVLLSSNWSAPSLVPSCVPAAVPISAELFAYADSTGTN